ncbi:MAG: hypothetical protein KGL39_04840 [Patescibacteria group bacterium]|nr:hypothetical protein [Patescibacteria group bacterium]
MTDFPIEVDRLRSSWIWARCRERPELTRGVVNLWLSAWLANPKGQLPNDDASLAHAADVTLLEFAALKDDLLHGFVKSGAFLLHPVIIEKAANRPKRIKRDYGPYSEPFQRFWERYEGNKICPSAPSKHEAWEVWNEKLTELPSIEIILAAVDAYKASLKRKGASDSFAKHPARFIRNAMWEGIMDAAKESSAKDTDARAAWCGRAAPLVDKIGANVFLAWFKGCSLKLGPPVEIAVPTEFAKQHIERNFARQIAAAFQSEFTIKLSTPTPTEVRG